MMKNFISSVCILAGISVAVSSCEQNQGNSAPSNSSGIPSTPDNPPSPGGNTVPKDLAIITVDKTTLYPTDNLNTAQFTITNSGSSPFTIKSILENNTTGQFFVKKSCLDGKSLDVSATCSINVQWNGGASDGSYSFVLTTDDGTLKTSPKIMVSQLSVCPQTTLQNFPGSDWSSFFGSCDASGEGTNPCSAFKFKFADWNQGKISCYYGSDQGLIGIKSNKTYRDPFMNFPKSATSSWTDKRHCESADLSQCPFVE